MRINVTQGIKDYEGNLVMAVKMENGQPVLDEKHQPVKVVEQVRTYFISALNSQIPNETLLAEDKAQIYYLSVKLYRGKEVDLTESDRKFILDRVGKIYPSPLIYGRIMDLLSGDETEVDQADLRAASSNANDEKPAAKDGKQSK